MIEKHKSIEVSVKQNLKLTQKFGNCVSDTKLARYMLKYKLCVIELMKSGKVLNQ
jgi:hypothetical protein